MRKLKKTVSVLLVLVTILSLNACSSQDFKSDVQGTWAIYHYYENKENGADVFFDDTNFWTVTIDDKSFEITSADGSLENKGGTYEWVKDDEAQIIMTDDMHCTMRISANDKKHSPDAMFNIYVVETNTYYILESMSSGD